MVTPPGGPAPADEATGPRQAYVYRAYIQLQSMAALRYDGDLAGRLVLCLGFGQRGAELALATVIAGGAFLGVEPDPQLLKAAVRQGACDFMVNSLDEALRVLKNELRKRTPLSAGLLGDPSVILPEMLERGVQPDLVADTPGLKRIARFVERGAVLFPNDEMSDDAKGETVWTDGTPQDLRRMDKIALDLLPPGDRVRRAWLARAAGYFHRQTPLQRVLGVSPEERNALLEAISSPQFQTEATISWRDADGTDQKRRFEPA